MQNIRALLARRLIEVTTSWPHREASVVDRAGTSTRTDATRQEFEELVRNEAFELTELPAGRKPISSKWVLTWETDQAVEIVGGKARLVAKGFQQRDEGMDYVDVFSPTPGPSSICIIAVATLQRDWLLNHWCVVKRFVQ